MAIPDFQSLMLPLMRIATDGKEHNLREAIDSLAEKFALSEEDREELLPSGRQSRFDNRVGWAKTYLTKTRLLESTGRGTFRITDRGLRVLQQNPDRIDQRYLAQFPELEEFRQGGNKEDHGTPVATVQATSASNELTPEEQLEASFQTLSRELAEDILQRVMECTPRFFERLVVELLVAMGYGGSRKDAGEAVGRTGDNGIDGIIKEDKLGLDIVYIQAKRWQDNIGSRELRDFVGSLEYFRAQKGVFITTSEFSPRAKEYIKGINKKVVLIDGQYLAQLMIEYGIGVTRVETYVINRLDNDYFLDE